MKDFSQFGEQAVILEHVGAKRGRFLDIGAYDAFVFSNVRALFELGWTGLLVEPHPVHAERLRGQYPAESGVQVVEAAVGPLPGTGHLRTTLDATSTMHAPTYDKWRGECAYDAETTEVPVLSLTQVFASGPFDVVSIDAEGWSVPLLDRMFQLGHRPRVVVVEHDHGVVQVALLGRNAGYRVALRNGTNVVLVKVA